MRIDLGKAAELLRQRRRTLILAHLEPDGDAWGSMCALAEICRLLNREARLLLPGPLPEFLSWLEAPVPVARDIDGLGDWKPDLAVFLDCGRPDRTGKEGEALAQGKIPNWGKVDVINLDHHVDNPGFGLVSLVEPEAGATAEIIGLMAEYLGLPLGGYLGEAIYLGLTSDSGNFTYANSSASLMALAARIVGQGLKVENFTAKSENNWSPERMRLWGELMLAPRLFARDRAVSVLAPLSLLEKHNCQPADLENLVSFMLHMRGVEVAVLIREKPDGGSKISLRAKGGSKSVNVRKTASALGGGGHDNAAGANVPMNMEEAEQKVLEFLLPDLD
ncbi:MAG: bifunctional oligoribonuclease/PAP phosphatase NrnA [Desulfovibrionaceae bacterium]|nr:bifunctional oligoribonuclease/PAP phosphatase NrnA [Desulfovibrionaceae bacterium]